MSVENQILVDDLNGPMFGNKKYEIKKGNTSSNNNTKTIGNISNTQSNNNNYNNNNNSTSSSRINLIETIENISEGMVTNNNYSSHSSSNSNSRFGSNNNKNININTNSYKHKNNNININNNNNNNKTSGNYSKKNSNLINKKNYHISTNSTNTNQFHPYQEDENEHNNEEDIIVDNNPKEMYHMNETNNTVNMKNTTTVAATTNNKNVKHAKTEKKEKKKKIMNGAYTHISQIYDTDDFILKNEEEKKEEEEEEEEKEESTKETKEYSTFEENSFVAHFYAAIFIIVGIIILLHTYLDENHVLIQALSNISNYILACLKSLAFGRSIMHAVSITNAGIDKILNEMANKYEGTDVYVDALKKINTEFCVLSLFTMLTLFICGMFCNIICNIVDVKKKKVNMSRQKTHSEKMEKNKSISKPVLVMNRMTVEEFDDRTFTYNEIKKLHEDEDYICLKNKRAGDGVDAWNWQSRLANATGQKNTVQNEPDICSDINLSDMSSSESSASPEEHDEQNEENKTKQ